MNLTPLVGAIVAAALIVFIAIMAHAWIGKAARK